MNIEKTVTIEVSPADFDDTDILFEAKARGLGFRDAQLVFDLAHAIEKGQQANAQHILELLVRGSDVLEQAAAAGRRQAA